MATRTPVRRMSGHYEHSLDDKGRVIVPQALREHLGNEFVLMTGAGNHLRAYPMEIWEGLQEQLESADIFDEQNEDLNLLQRLYGNCEFVSIDPQNRISISRHLRKWADLVEGDTAIILGLGQRVEIWSRTKWEEFYENFTPQRVAEASKNRKAPERPRQAEEDASPAPTEAA